MPVDHARLTELFVEAFELEGDAREAFLARISDPELAKELAALLAVDRGSDLINTAVLNVVPRAENKLHVPGYVVGELLGEGGMGAVYAGEQLQPPRPVAIKVLHVSSGPVLARFWMEAKIMARLDHPGIARVLESGEAGGHPFIVMERVVGKTLDHFMNEPLAMRLKLFASICDAVHHAHLNGVIHRDLKPSNVMVRDDGRIAVLDFGIARAEGAGETRAGDLIGTPLYMSPEQASLRADEVDARADVYSLGVTLYELVTGELPYPIRGRSVADIREMICNTAPASLADRDLDAIAANALAKDPRDRYQSATALADDIRRHLAGRGVSVRTPGTLEAMRRFVRRRPAVAAVITSAIVVALAFAIVVTRLYLRAEAARSTLAVRTNDLVLQQARAIVAHDPTAALALLDEVHANAWAVDVVASEARGRGVASHVLRGHHDEVHWVEQLADHSLVTASYDGSVRLWQPSLETSRVIFQAAHGRIHDARPSPDGAVFAIGGDAGALHVVDRDGHARELAGHLGDVERAVWSGDGAWLATGDDRGGTMLWPKGAAPGRMLAGPAAKIEAIAFSTERVCAGDDDGIVWTWPLGAGSLQRLPTGDRGGIRAVWCGGDTVTAVTESGSIRTWHGGIEAPAIESHVPTRRAEITGSVAVLAGAVGTVARVENGVVEELGVHASMVRGLAVGRTKIASGGEDGVIQVWDRESGRHVTLRGHRQRIRQLAFSRDDAVLYSADGEGVVRVWDLAAMPPTFFADHDEPIEHLATDGKTLVSADDTGLVVRTDLASGSTHAIGRATVHITALATLGDDVISGDVAGTVTWWRTNVHAPVGSNVHAIAVGRDRVAIATEAGPIFIFDRSGAQIVIVPGHEGGTEALAYSADGLLASGGQDRSIRLWRDGRAVGELPGPTGDTYFVMFAHDTLISAGDDGVVRAWTVHGDTATSPRIVGSHVGAVTAIAIGGDYVASVGRDATVTRARLDSARFETAQITDRGSLGLTIDAHGHVLIASANGDVEHWDAEVTTTSSTTTTTAAVALGTAIVLGGLDGTVRVVSQP